MKTAIDMWDQPNKPAWGPFVWGYDIMAMINDCGNDDEDNDGEEDREGVNDEHDDHDRIWQCQIPTHYDTFPPGGNFQVSHDHNIGVDGENDYIDDNEDDL